MGTVGEKNQMISVIVSVYNTERFLSKCVDSVINQTYGEIEILLINDGSTDDSLSICQGYERKYENIKLISQKNKGIAAVRNLALKHTRNEYVSFIDSDDWIEPSMLERLYLSIVANDADISICDFSIDYLNEQADKKPNKGLSFLLLTKEEALSELFIEEKFGSHVCAKLYKKKLFDQITFPLNRCYEDTSVLFEVFNKASRVVKINSQEYHYVQHSDSITANSVDEKKNMDRYYAFVDQLMFIKKNEDKLVKLNQVKSSVAKQFYKIKRQVIHTFDLKSEAYLRQEKEINKGMRSAIKNISPWRFGLLAYIKYKAALNHPKTFLLYLKMTRGRA